MSNTPPVVETAFSELPVSGAVWVMSPTAVIASFPPSSPAKTRLPAESLKLMSAVPLLALKVLALLPALVSVIGPLPAPLTIKSVDWMAPDWVRPPATVSVTGPPSMNATLRSPIVSLIDTGATRPLATATLPSSLSCVSSVIGSTPDPWTVRFAAAIGADCVTAPAALIQRRPAFDFVSTRPPVASWNTTEPEGLTAPKESTLLVCVSSVIAAPLPVTVRAVALMKPDCVSGPPTTMFTGPPWMKAMSSAPSASLIPTPPLPLLAAKVPIAFGWVSSAIVSLRLPWTVSRGARIAPDWVTGPAAVITMLPTLLASMSREPLVSLTTTLPGPFALAGLVAPKAPSLLACESRTIAAPLPVTASDTASMTPDCVIPPLAEIPTVPPLIEPIDRA